MGYPDACWRAHQDHVIDLAECRGTSGAGGESWCVARGRACICTGPVGGAWRVWRMESVAHGECGAAVQPATESAAMTVTGSI